MTGKSNGHELRDLPGESASTSLAELLVERDRLLADREETIRDLRARLDAEAEERRRVQAQLTALLSGKRESPATEPLPPAPWPRRVLSWLVKQHV
jgi:hypothetical protein